jgi:large subunit ribosomal protein LP1
MPGLKGLSKEGKDEVVTTLAALLLHDAGAEITSDKISEVISASGNSVEKYWPGMFAGLLAKADVSALISSSTAPGAGGGGGGAPAAAGAAPAAEKKDEKKEKKEEKKEEPAAEVAGAGDLFGGGGGGKY